MKNLLGKILQELLQKEGSPSVKDFANMMGLSNRTVYNMQNGLSPLTFDQVIRASEILNFNIIEEYYTRAGIGDKFDKLSEASNEYRPIKNIIKVTISIAGTIAAYDRFPELLNKIKINANEYGFEIA